MEPERVCLCSLLRKSTCLVNRSGQFETVLRLAGRSNLKLCTNCGVTKPLSDFHKSAYKKDGVQTHCKTCSNNRAAAWNKDNPLRIQYFRDRDRTKYRAQKYGLTEQELRDMLDESKGVCAICSRTDRLVVDHNHDTGVVRGLICHKCNRGLGHFNDDPSLLTLAAEYLVVG